MRLIQYLLKPSGARAPKATKLSLPGVALLMVLVTLSILMIIVTDMGYHQTLRFKLAIHQRDSAKAEFLAGSGLNVARLFLVLQDKLQKYFVQF